MDKLAKWKMIQAELMAAYSLLPLDSIESTNGYSREDFLTYIYHNELLLAMEELDGVIIDNPSPPKQFWTHMIQAASLMGREHANKYKVICSMAT